MSIFSENSENLNYAVLVETGVIVYECIEGWPYRTNFFRQLSYKPVGIITPGINFSVQFKLDEMAKLESKRNYKEHKEKFLERLKAVTKPLKLEKVERRRLGKNILEVNNFFKVLSKAERYQDKEIPIIPFKDSKFTFDRYPFKKINPEIGDRILLAEAVCLTEKYLNLYLASYDRHFIAPVVSERIRDRFGINCDLPENIVKQIT